MRKCRMLGVFAFAVMVLTMILTAPTLFADASKIDVTAAHSGVFTVCETAHANAKMKVGVTHSGKTTYYDYISGSETTYSFAKGSGSYAITLYRNVSGSAYKPVETVKVEVEMENELAHYLCSTSEIAFEENCAVSRKAAEICKYVGTDEDKVKAIHNYIAANYTYDEDKAAAIASGSIRLYIPDTAAIFADDKGICYDFSSLFAAMCRSQGIPCAIAKGTLDGGAHAWNMVYIDGEWHAVDMTRSIAQRGMVAQYAQCLTDLKAYNYRSYTF